MRADHPPSICTRRIGSQRQAIFSVDATKDSSDRQRGARGGERGGVITRESGRVKYTKRTDLRKAASPTGEAAKRLADHRRVAGYAFTTFSQPTATLAVALRVSITSREWRTMNSKS